MSFLRTTTKATKLRSNGLRPVFFYGDGNLNYTHPRLPIRVSTLFIHSGTLRSFHQTPQYKRTTRGLQTSQGRLVPPHGVASHLVMVISTTMFTIFTRRTNTSRGLRHYTLHFSSAGSFPCSAALLNVRGRSFTFPVPVPKNPPWSFLVPIRRASVFPSSNYCTIRLHSTSDPF